KPDVLTILDSNPQRFLIKTLQSVAAGLILTMLLSWIFPGLCHGYGQAVGAAVLAISSRVTLRPLVRMLVKHKKIVEGVLILGREDLASKLYQDLINGDGHFEFKGIFAGLAAEEGAGMALDYRGLK